MAILDRRASIAVYLNALAVLNSAACCGANWMRGLKCVNFEHTYCQELPKASPGLWKQKGITLPQSARSFIWWVSRRPVHATNSCATTWVFNWQVAIGQNRHGHTLNVLIIFSSRCNADYWSVLQHIFISIYITSICRSPKQLGLRYSSWTCWSQRVHTILSHITVEGWRKRWMIDPVSASALPAVE
jgi:hypothetical protein